MLQKTFNDFQNVVTAESVKLTTDLLQDIEMGTRYPILNGEVVTFREKEIASYMLCSYADIIQSYVLTDIGNVDNDSRIVNNLYTRENMQDLILGVNKITGFGLNESEDFILDRVPFDPPSTNLERFTATADQTLFVSQDFGRGTDLIFIDDDYINNINNYYFNLNTKRYIFNIPLNAGQQVAIFHYDDNRKVEYVAIQNQDYIGLPFTLLTNDMVFRNGDFQHSGYTGIGSTSVVFDQVLNRGEKIAVVHNQNIERDNFTGDGITTNFDLSFTLSPQNLVFLSNEFLHSGYSGFNSTTIMFDTAPMLGAEISVIAISI